jgi:transposase
VSRLSGSLPGTGLADLWAQEGLPFVLGHALSMKAIHGGTAKHDNIDAHKIAALLRGGLLPPASVYPAERRAPRDLLRRRTPLLRQRAELLAHGQKTNSPDHRPELGKNIACKANREGVAERFAEPAVHKTIAVDLAPITYDEKLLEALELSIWKPAQQPEATTLYLLQTVPGIGKILSLVLPYDIHHLDRFPRVQDFASYGRLVKCAKDSAGKRVGPSGKDIGKAPRQWAFAEAAPLFLRHNPAGQRLLARLEKTHGQGKALTILAHKLARAVYDLLKRKTAFAMDLFLRTEGAERVSLAPHWTTQGDEPLSSTRFVFEAASVHAKVCLGLFSRSLAR